MIQIHLWDPIHCVLRLAWRSAVAARRLKPLTAVAVLACGGITVVPPGPPTSAQPPVPPSIVVPPTGLILRPPWGPSVPWAPPVYEYIPSDTEAPALPIPLGPVLTPDTLLEALTLPPTTTIAFHGNPFAEAPCDTPAAVLPEPGGLAIVGIGLIALYLTKRKQT